jgi:hypothetical protein
MTTTKNKLIAGIALLCSKDATQAPASTTYQLKFKDQLGVSGTATFTQTSSTVTTIAITLTGGSTTSHPAHIHLRTAAEGGAIAVTLSDVVNGKSSTSVTKLDDNTPVNYSQLIAFDGYINVHESVSNLSMIIAQGDIGGNVLTGNSKSYPLDTVGNLGVTGTAKFEKRTNGKALVTVSLNNPVPTGSYPTAIHIGSVVNVGGGQIALTLNDLDGATGKSITSVRTLDAGDAVSYDNLLVYDGYLLVNQPQPNNSPLCKGNIGSH